MAAKKLYAARSIGATNIVSSSSAHSVERNREMSAASESPAKCGVHGHHWGPGWPLEGHQSQDLRSRRTRS